jgi:hypothetical protein
LQRRPPLQIANSTFLAPKAVRVGVLREFECAVFKGAEHRESLVASYSLNVGAVALSRSNPVT